MELSSQNFIDGTYFDLYEGALFLTHSGALGRSTLRTNQGVEVIFGDGITIHYVIELDDELDLRVDEGGVQHSGPI